jgi:hypothetical protein
MHLYDFIYDVYISIVHTHEVYLYVYIDKNISTHIDIYLNIHVDIYINSSICLHRTFMGVSVKTHMNICTYLWFWMGVFICERNGIRILGWTAIAAQQVQWLHTSPSLLFCPCRVCFLLGYVHTYVQIPELQTLELFSLSIVEGVGTCQYVRKYRSQHFPPVWREP